MAAPLVIVSRRRISETSWGLRPGFVGEEGRMSEMRTGVPVRVERTRRVGSCWWDWRRRGG